MHLVALSAQRVHFAATDAVLELAEGDTIQTEISRKFTHGSLEAMVCGAGFAIERHYEARAPAFSLVLARPM